jgi:hypothetical protein
MILTTGSQGINSSFVFRFSLPGEMQRSVEDGSGLCRFPQDLLLGAKNNAAAALNRDKLIGNICSPKRVTQADPL